MIEAEHFGTSIQNCRFQGKKVMISPAALFRMRCYDFDVRTVCAMLNDIMDCPKKKKPYIKVKMTTMRICSERKGVVYNMFLNALHIEMESVFDLEDLGAIE